MQHTENAVVQAVSDAQCVRKKVRRGMLVHSINGVDVMNSMQTVSDVERVLDELELPI